MVMCTNSYVHLTALNLSPPPLLQNLQISCNSLLGMCHCIHLGPLHWLPRRQFSASIISLLFSEDIIKI